jgi:hypothetical protein
LIDLQIEYDQVNLTIVYYNILSFKKLQSNVNDQRDKSEQQIRVRIN